MLPFEMLIVNLLVIDRCSERKYGRAATIGIMSLFAVIILGFSYMITRFIPDFGSGNGLFVFCGFLFFFPIKLLYNNSAAKIISLACTSWVYTFLLFSMAIHIGRMIDALPMEISSVLAQTLLYLVTLPFFTWFLRTSFLPMLANLSEAQSRTLMWMSIVWFFTVFAINFSFVYPDQHLYKLLAMAAVAACAIISYRYIYQLTSSHRTIQTLEKIAYHDDLTQLRSRVVLSNDMEDLIRRNLPFYVIYMDLNDFKSINDGFGHHVGDQYLATFALEVKLRLGNRGGFYRIAGDEFVCIFTAPDVDSFVASLATLPQTLPDNQNVRFLGVSYGLASYSDDGYTMDELLRCADMRMYEMKQLQKRGG